jgi:hypothetical protein
VWAGLGNEDPRPHLEGGPWARSITKVSFLLFSPNETDHNWYASPEEEYEVLKKEINYRRAVGLEEPAILVYPDRRPYSEMDWVYQIRRDGYCAIPTIFAYPANDETPEAVRDAVQKDVDHLKSIGETQLGIMRAVYTQQHRWKIELVWGSLEVTDTIIEHEPTIIVDALYGAGRPGGNFNDWPEIQAWYTQRCMGIGARGPEFIQGDTPMPELYIKTRNGLFVSSKIVDGTRKLYARTAPGDEKDWFSVWRPILSRGTKVGEPGNLVYLDLANFKGNTIGISRFDAVGEQAACAIRSGTAWTNGRGDDNDWTFETEPPAVGQEPMRLTLRMDLPDAPIRLELGPPAFPKSVGSFRYIDVKTGKEYTEPFK